MTEHTSTAAAIVIVVVACLCLGAAALSMAYREYDLHENDELLRSPALAGGVQSRRR